MKGNPLEKIVPAFFIDRIAKAVSSGRMGMTLIISKDAMEKLSEDKPALLELKDGSVIMLLAETTVNKVYGKESG